MSVYSDNPARREPTDQPSRPEPGLAQSLAFIDRTLARIEPGEPGEQIAFWPVDDFVGVRRYVPCPRRGTHLKLTDCWMCWCDEHLSGGA